MAIFCIQKSLRKRKAFFKRPKQTKNSNQNEFYLLLSCFGLLYIYSVHVFFQHNNAQSFSADRRLLLQCLYNYVCTTLKGVNLINYKKIYLIFLRCQFILLFKNLNFFFCFTGVSKIFRHLLKKKPLKVISTDIIKQVHEAQNFFK